MREGASVCIGVSARKKRRRENRKRGRRREGQESDGIQR
jgi:hypothetical protein